MSTLLEENEEDNLAVVKIKKAKKARKVGLVNGPRQWLENIDALPKILERTSMTQSLIQSYGLCKKVTNIEAVKASRSDLESFHSSDYLDYCEKTTNNEDLEKLEIENGANGQDKYGLEYDCQLMPNLMELMQWIAGGSLTAAQSLADGHVQVAINWGGGWHHAQRDEASGFCYVNDIVLAIQKLRQVFDKVLYIDLDVHHGDGVENAFAFSPKVFTFSIHKHESGYFPGTGNINEVGQGKGKYYALNFPLKDGINDENYLYIFQNLLSEINYAFRPDAVVVQAGADALARDPLGGFNLTPQGLGKCLGKVLDLELPLLVLGGGGYNKPNAARFWTYLTALIIGDHELSSDIPDTDPYFKRYGPSFELSLAPGCRANLNSNEDICDNLEEAFRNLEELS